MRKFTSALALCAALLVAPASAQTAGVPLHVRTGDVYTVDVEQTQSTDMGGGQNVEATLRHSYSLHIVDAEQRVWRYTPVSLSYSLPSGLGLEAQTAAFDWPAMSEAMSAMVRIGTDIGFECRVNEYGRCVELSNWPVWRDRVENLVLMADAIARMIPAAAPSPDVGVVTEPEPPSRKSDDAAGNEADVAETPAPALDWQTLRGPVLRGLASMLDNVDGRDAAASMAFIDTPAFLQGRSLTRRERVPVSEELEMPFGAPPLRYAGTIRLDRINQRENTATVVRQVSLDETSARAAAQSITQFFATNFVEPVAALGGQAGDTAALAGLIEPIVDAISIRYDETTTGVIDLSTGMARETTTEYTLSILPPGGEGDGVPLAMNGRTVIRITPGAPAVPRLPRG